MQFAIKYDEYMSSMENKTIDSVPIAVYLLSADRQGTSISFRRDGRDAVTLKATDILAVEDHGQVEKQDGSLGPRRVVIWLNPTTIDPLLLQVLRNVERYRIHIQNLAAGAGCAQEGASNNSTQTAGGMTREGCVRNCKDCGIYDACSNSKWCCISTLGTYCKSCAF